MGMQEGMADGNQFLGSPYERAKAAGWTPGPFYPLSERALWVQRVLILMALVALVSLVSDWAQIRLIGSGAITPQAAAQNDARQDLLGVLRSLTLGGAFVLFLFWLHRARCNLDAVVPVAPEYSPAWVIVSFFVPVLNVYLPYKVVKEVWQSSDAGRGGGAALVGYWWAAWVCAGVLTRVAQYFLLTSKTVPECIAATQYDMVGLAAIIAVAVVKLRLVATVTRAQVEKARACGHNPEEDSLSGLF